MGIAQVVFIPIPITRIILADSIADTMVNTFSPVSEMDALTLKMTDR